MLWLIYEDGDFMFKKFINIFKGLDKLTFKIMKNGLKFCFVICILSVLILATYNLSILSPFLYYIGIALFRLSIIFAIEFIICGLVVDGIKKQAI